MIRGTIVGKGKSMDPFMKEAIEEALMRDFIARNPDLWNEDIGVPE
jgi:hypothetical protein